MAINTNPHAMKGAGEGDVRTSNSTLPLAAPQGETFDTTHVYDNAPDEFLHRAGAAIAELARRGTPFTTEDMRALGVPEPDHPNRWGAVMQAAHKAGDIRPVAATTAARKPRHGGLHRLWEGAGQAGGER